MASAVCVDSAALVSAEVTLGLVPVVQEVAANAESATTHATVLARKAETEAGSIFNDSPVSSFAISVDRGDRFYKSRKLAKFCLSAKTPA